MPNYGNKSFTKELTVDDVTTKIIGDFGRWQAKIIILMSLLKLPLCWYQLNIIFMAPPQDFWCAKPKAFAAYSNNEWRKFCTPYVEEYPCLIFDPDILALSPNINRLLVPLVTCHKFEYDNATFRRTIMSDWDLVCDRHWLLHITQGVMMTGIVIGSILFGIIADKYGRKDPLMIAIALQIIASYVTCLAPWFSMFLVSWFVLALACGGISIISFVMCMEVASGKWRTIISVLYQLPFGLGNAILASLSYWLRDWRKLEFALATLCTVYLTYWFLIPESPRWLLATEQYVRAIEILRDAARENKRSIDLYEIECLLPKGKRNSYDVGFMAYFASKNMRRKTLLLSAEWFLTGLSFFTFSQYLGSIGTNIFLSVAVSGIISIPGCLCCLFIITIVGRKIVIGTFQIITIVCFVVICTTPNDNRKHESIRLLCAGTGFAALSGTVPALYLFSAELFPTVGRNVGVSGVSTFARVASMVAPAVTSLDYSMQDLPIVLLLIASVAQILLLLPLPETKGSPLPDTLEEAEHFK